MKRNFENCLFAKKKIVWILHCAFISLGQNYKYWNEYSINYFITWIYTTNLQNFEKLCCNKAKIIWLYIVYLSLTVRSINFKMRNSLNCFVAWICTLNLENCEKCSRCKRRNICLHLYNQWNNGKLKKIILSFLISEFNNI